MGINIEDALSRCSNNTDLLIKLLVNFAKRYTHFIDAYEQASREGTETLHRFLHTFRGAVSSVGASELSDKADLLEQHVLEGMDQVIVQAQLEACQSDINDMLPQIHQLIGMDPLDTVDNDTATDVTVQQLKAAIEESDTDAIHIAKQLMANLSDVSERSILVSVLENLEGFDFDGAMEKLGALEEG